MSLRAGFGLPLAYGDDGHRPGPPRARAARGGACGRRERLPAPGRAAPARTARPLLPDARLSPRRGRRGAGRAAARVARAAAVRGALDDAELALQDHDERLPQRDRPAAEGPRSAGGLRRGRRPARRRRRAARRVGVDAAVSRRAARPRRRPRGARRALRPPRVRRARVRRRAPAPGAEPARGADHARGARLLREGVRRRARDDRRVDQQRAAAGAQDGRREAPGADAAGDAARARRRAGARARAALRRRVGERRRVAGRRDAHRGRDVLDAAERRVVPRARRDRGVPADGPDVDAAPVRAGRGERAGRVRDVPVGGRALPRERDPLDRLPRRAGRRDRRVPGPRGVPRVRAAVLLGLSERRFEGALDRRRLVGDLAGGEAQRAPAGGGVDGVAPAVGFEGLPRLVVLPAVGLDEDAVGFEDEVGFKELDVVVDRGLREAGGAAELQEALLELRFGEGGAGRVVLEGCQELAGSAVAGGRSGQGIEGKVGAEPRVLRSVEQALDAAAVEAGGEVEDRAAGDGDGDPVLRGRLAVEGARTMDADARLAASSSRSGHRHIDDRRLARAGAPQRAGRVWLSTEPAPQARTAAIQWPRAPSTVWPTAYTPR